MRDRSVFMAKTSSDGMSTLFSEPTTESSKDSLSGFDSVVTSCCSCAKGDPLLIIHLSTPAFESPSGSYTGVNCRRSYSHQGYGLKVIMNVIMVINIITVIITFPNCDLKVTCRLLQTAVSAIRPIV